MIVSSISNNCHSDRQTTLNAFFVSLIISCKFQNLFVSREICMRFPITLQLSDSCTSLSFDSRFEKRCDIDENLKTYFCSKFMTTTDITFEFSFFLNNRRHSWRGRRTWGVASSCFRKFCFIEHQNRLKIPFQRRIVTRFI